MPRGAGRLLLVTLPKAASLENNKAPDIAPGAYCLSMISCFYFNIPDDADVEVPGSLSRLTFLPNPNV